MKEDSSTNGTVKGLKKEDEPQPETHTTCNHLFEIIYGPPHES